MDIKEIKETLEHDYILVKKGKLWSFLGGALAFVVVAGIISYQASLAAIEDTAAANAIREIERLKQEANDDVQEIKTQKTASSDLISQLEQRVQAISQLSNDLEQIKSLIRDGNPWNEHSDNIKDAINDTHLYEYAIIRNNGFRVLSASSWNGGYRVMTDPHMTGDNQSFTLGGSVWIWDTKDPRDDSGVLHLYYYAKDGGIIATSGNGPTGAEKGGEGKIYRRMRK